MPTPTTKKTTIVGTVAGAPHAPHALPNTCTPQSPALWVTSGHATPATIAGFIASNGGNTGVVFVPYKNNTNPCALFGLTAKPGTTRANCLNTIGNGVTIAAAQAAAKYGPAKPGAPVQKGRPSIKSAWLAWLQGSYNPAKGGKPLGMLVALPKA